MHDRLLVGVTDSLASRAAVRWSMRRAAVAGSAVTLVHVTARNAGRTGAIDGMMLLKRETAFASSIAPSSVVVRAELVTDTVTDALVAMSAHADLLVLGTHHAGFVHGTVFGSTSLQLAASARSPVVIVPSRVETKPAGVVVGVDESSIGIVAVRAAAQEAHDTGEPLTLIRVWDPPRGHSKPSSVAVQHRSPSTLSSLATYARATHPGLQVQIRSDQRIAAGALVDAARSATLLVVGDTYPRAGMPITPGAICHDVLMTSATPTMVVHPALEVQDEKPAAA